MGLFYQGNDPLLTQRTTTNIYPPIEPDPYRQTYRQQLLEQLKEPTPAREDWLSELDGRMKNLEPDVQNALSMDQEFARLNGEIQGAIQKEIMILVKGRLNSDPTVVGAVKRQLEIIDTVTSRYKAEERQSLNELNDYMKNYSHLTFDEYKKVKAKKNETRRSETQTPSVV